MQQLLSTLPEDSHEAETGLTAIKLVLAGMSCLRPYRWQIRRADNPPKILLL